MGSKGLLYLWLASAVILTIIRLGLGFTVHYYYSPDPLDIRQVLLFAASQFVFWSFFSGVCVWNVVLFGPRPTPAASNGMSVLPLTVPAAKLEAERGLTSILRRYQGLLATYATVLDTAPLNPYPSVLRAFRGAARGFLPSSVQQAKERERQMGSVPNILAIDLIGAEAVLAEVESLTVAQLSAIEECHRMNVRRLRQRAIFGWNWRSGVAVLIGVIGGLVLAVEKVSGAKLSNLLPPIGGITLKGFDIESIIFRGAIGVLVMGLMTFISDGIRYLPMLQRLQAFEGHTHHR